MKELELVFEVLERSPYSVKALGFVKGGIIVFGTEVLDEDETDAVFGGGGIIGGGGGGGEVTGANVVRVLKGFDGAKKVRPGNGVNSVAELVVKVPDFL